MVAGEGTPVGVAGIGVAVAEVAGGRGGDVGVARSVFLALGVARMGLGSAGVACLMGRGVVAAGVVGR